MPELPVVAYIHSDDDMKDEELVKLMIAFEENSKNLSLVLKIAQKRIDMNQRDIASQWLDYAETIAIEANKDEINKMREKMCK